ncbi:MAG: hypothetical protein AB7P20_12610, partial [Rhizobiaceae bacterium]
MSFLAALQTEIDDLEASLRASPDPRLVKLQELRRIEALYQTGASPSAPSPKPSAPDARGGRSGRQPSPERMMALAKAKEFLEGATSPVRTVDILNHLFEDGIMVGGNSPVSNLSAMLYHSPDFQSHGRKGWTLKLPAAEPPEEKAVDAEPTGD